MPLERFAIIDASTSIAGRYCARLFARLGARVSRTVQTDDNTIGYGGMAGEVFGKWLDEGKSAIPNDTGISALATLAIVERTTDSPQVALRLEIDWFLEGGPYGAWKANDPIIQALVGLSHGFGPAEGPPLIAQGHAPQLVAGTVAFIAGLAALLGRERGRVLNTVDVSIFEAACCFSEPNSVSYAHFGHKGRRLGINRYAPTYPCSIYPAMDGWIGVTCLTPAQWSALAEMIGQPELTEDARFATTQGRLEHADLVDAILRPAFAVREAAATAEEGQRRRIPMALVSDLGDLAQLKHWRERASFDAAGRPGLPFRLDWKGPVKPLPPVPGNAPPLAGVRVVDFTMGWAGPLCTRTLADLGADVVKIESNVRPDWWRGWEKPVPGVTVEAAPVFSVVNRGKSGVLLDLTTKHGIAAAESLIRGADVVVENFATGVLAKLGLSSDRLRTLQPDLISMSMGAFGAKGRWSGFRAYGSTVEQASGIPTINGTAGMPPALQHIAYGDPVAGLYAASAVLVALAARGQSGGCDIDLSQVETLFQLSADAIIARQVTGAPLPRSGSRRPQIAPCGCFAAAGADNWVAIACNDDASWQALCKVLGRDDWANMAGFATPLGRNAHAGEIGSAISAWISEKQAPYAVALLQSAGVPAAPVQPVEALVSDPELHSQGYWVELERAHLGRHLSGAAPFRFDGVRPCAARPAPLLGEHHEENIGRMPEEMDAP